MFVLSRDVSVAKRVIATLLAAAIVLWATGGWSTARAENITDVYDLLTDSAPGANSDHTIYFEVPNGVSAGGGQIVIDFPDTFDLTSVDVTDIDMAVGATDQDITGVDWTVTVDTATSSITFTSVAGSIASLGSTTILIGTNATGGVANEQINNPTTPLGGNESFEIDISAGTDAGHTRVVILDTVLVTASVDTIFNFTVYENDTGEDVNGATTNASSSTTTIPFGTLSQYAPVIISQDLTVETNAINGFVVTVQTDGPLESTTGADIDYFKDGTVVTTPEAWESPSVGLDIDLENTWGHWGVTSEDATTTRSNEFGSNQWIGVDTTPVVIFSHDGPADPANSEVPGQGSTTVGYQVEISPLQEAADDYSTVLTYIATPTF